MTGYLQQKCMDSEISFTTSSKLGNLVLEISDGKLVSLTIDSNNQHASVQTKKSLTSQQLVNAIRQQLGNYFTSVTPFADIELLPQGTAFQKSVWKELCNIPLGETRTYGDIAKILHSSPRAVGNACRKNPIAIIIPCHRVVSAQGIGGYAGQTQGEQLDIKRWLLNHEGVKL